MRKKKNYLSPMDFAVQSSSFLFILLFFFFLLAVLGCVKESASVGTQAESSPFASFRDIPGVTEKEIADIGALQRKYTSFIYGMTMSTEAFQMEDDESGKYPVGGYSALFCEWLTGIFGIRFQPEILVWSNLVEKLNAGELDFAGNLTPTEERQKIYYMTDPIAERQYKTIQLAGSPPLNRIAMARPLRYVFIEGAAIAATVATVAEEGTYESIFVNNYEEAYSALEGGIADAFIGDSAVILSFDAYGDVYAGDFLPLIFSSVSMATSKDELAPVISVIKKAQRNGVMPYLNNLFNQGQDEYKRHKFFTRLDEKEKSYLRNTVTVPLVTQYFNYPIIFFDTHGEKWDGIAFDLLHLVEKLSGLNFQVINNEHTEMPELMDLLSEGKGHIFTDLIFTKEREPYFLWNSNKFMTDQYALLSKLDYPNVNINEIPYKRIGLVKNTAHKEMFHIWFPNAVNIIEYNNLDNAFLALEKGEVELVMAAKTKLLYYVNYFESSGFKANYLFNYSYESAFSFNRDQADLCSIVDKALSVIDTGVIVEQWVTKTYDYRTQLMEAQRPWLIGAIILIFIILVLVLVLLFRSRVYRKRLAKEEAQAMSREADERIKILFDTTPLASCMFDKNGNLLDCNQETVKMFEIPDKSFFINNFLTMLFPEYQPNGELSSVVSARNIRMAFEKGYYHFECMHKKLNGDPMPSEITLVCVKYKGEYALAGYFRDLTEQKAMEELEKQQAEAEAASRAKSSFLATMSHEMRTPMNAIIGMTSIGKNAENSERKDYAFNKIEEAAMHLLNVINDVLDISKIEANKLELSIIEFNFEKMLEKIVNIMHFRMEEKHQKFTLNIDKNLPIFVIGDDHHLSQVIINLLSNAVKFSPNKGEISLDVVMMGEQDGICEIRVGVSDNGIGITPEQKEKLFSAFEQADSGISRKFGGTGLGLSISKHIVELMGGAIWIESEPGKGSKFIFTVKVKRGAHNADFDIELDVKPIINAVGIFEGKRLLVAEDVEINREILISLLYNTGINIDCAQDGLAAVEMISASPAQYDAVLMDLQMPRMDGLEATKRIRAMTAPHLGNLPIIAMTAHVFKSDIDKCLEAGMNDHIGKPFDINDVLEKLHKYLCG
jgi:CheY-like chemotaxis protein